MEKCEWAVLICLTRVVHVWQFGIEDLKALPDQTDCWDGVRNYQVEPHT